MSIEYIAFGAVFIAGISCMLAFSFREKACGKAEELIRLQEEKDALLHEYEKVKALFHEQEKEYIALVKEREMIQRSYDGVQKYILETKELLVERMKALSHEVLTSTQSHFFTAAKAHFDESQKRFFADCSVRDEKVHSMLNPLKISLEQMNKKVVDLEMLRKESQGALMEQITSLSKETSTLIKALRHPGERGKWGETQLKRLVEMAGLIERCDFSIQETSSDGSLRADMIVTLPNARKVIIDAKVPLEGYIKAIEATSSEVYDREIEGHVEQLEKHIKTLSDKKYWAKYQESIDFTVLFLPSEALLAAALGKKSNLVEKALDKNILIATPTTMMALLHAVKLGWKESQLHKDIQDVVSLAKEWFSRSDVFIDHLQRLGKSLSTSVSSYNSAINSFESRFLVSLRKLAKEQRVGSGFVINELETISLPFAELQKEDTPFV